MFTGIVEQIGTVARVERRGGDARLTIGSPLAREATVGESIAVNGVCLTVAAATSDTFTSDVMPETLSRTTTGALVEGARVNLERALAADGRFGGHLVQGHVDATGAVLTREPGPRWDVVRIAVPARLARYVVAQGAIAVDGVSLTVVDAAEDAFTVSLIPTTLAATTLGDRAPGDEVNLEVDVLAKYVERLLARRFDVEPGGAPVAAGSERPS